jgi:hypothetical protein
MGGKDSGEVSRYRPSETISELVKGSGALRFQDQRHVLAGVVAVYEAARGKTGRRGEMNQVQPVVGPKTKIGHKPIWRIRQKPPASTRKVCAHGGEGHGSHRSSEAPSHGEVAVNKEDRLTHRMGTH